LQRAKNANARLPAKQTNFYQQNVENFEQQNMKQNLIIGHLTK
jgi:hypothetical protein